MNGAVPRVSICMPVYNGAAYIEEAIRSVLAQTYEDFRLIVTDNCSTDDTEAIVQSFDDPRVWYERNARNLGPVGNANRGLELADGEFVYVFHHDDVMLPANLERKVDILEQHPEVGLVHSDLILIDPSGGVVAPHSWNEEAQLDSFEPATVAFEKFVGTYHLGASIFIGTVLARRACYEHVGTFNPAVPHCHDGEMWMRMMLFHDVACIGEPLVKYRVHPASASSSWGDLMSEAYVREHHQAVEIVFDSYGSRIPETTQARVRHAFAGRYVALACRAFHVGDFPAGRKLMADAVALSPSIRRTPSYGHALARRAAGRTGLRVYRRLRRP